MDDLYRRQAANVEVKSSQTYPLRILYVDDSIVNVKVGLKVSLSGSLDALASADWCFFRFWKSSATRTSTLLKMAAWR